MYNAIATIPMSPTHEKKIGFYSIFTYLARYALQSPDVASVFGINMLGKTCINGALEAFKTSITSLGIEPNIWWIDEHLERALVLNKIQQLFETGIIQRATREVCRCSCGNVEYLSDVAILRGGKTLISSGNRAICCDSHITKQKEEVLVTAPLPSIERGSTFPRWAGIELQAILKKIAGTQLLISRKAKRDFHLETQERRWNVDTDVVWWLYPEWLHNENLQLQHLVVGSTILYQTAVMLAFSSLVYTLQPVTVHCLPKVYFQSNSSIHTIAEAITRFGVEKVVNTLLWCALSKRKEITLQGSLFSTMRDSQSDWPLHTSRKLLRA